MRVGFYFGGSPWDIGLSIGGSSVVILIFYAAGGHRVFDFTYWRPLSKIEKWSGMDK